MCSWARCVRVRSWVGGRVLHGYCFVLRGFRTHHTPLPSRLTTLCLLRGLLLHAPYTLQHT